MKNITEIISKLLNKNNLSFEESYGLMNQIMSGKISEIKLSSNLTS